VGTAGLVAEIFIVIVSCHSVRLQIHGLDGVRIRHPSNSHVATVRVGGSTSK
jgi:hypothetical protein